MNSETKVILLQAIVFLLLGVAAIVVAAVEGGDQLVLSLMAGILLGLGLNRLREARRVARR